MLHFFMDLTMFTEWNEYTEYIDLHPYNVPDTDRYVIDTDRVCGHGEKRNPPFTFVTF